MARIDLQGLKKTLEESISILKSWLSEYDTLITSIKQDAEVIKKSLSGINSQSAEGINALNKAVEETEKLVKDREKTDKKRIQTQRELKKIESEQLKLKKEYIKNSDEEVKGRIRLRKVQAEQKKLLEAEIILQKQEVNTQAERAERLKALKVLRDRVNTSTAEGVEKLQAYNKEIDELNETQRENSDELAKQKINVGNYTESINEALSSNQALNDSFGELSGVLTIVQKVQGRAADSLEEIKTASVNAGGGIRGFGAAAKAVGKQLLKNPIFLLVAALSAIGGAFATTREGAKTFKDGFAGISATIEVLISNLAIFAKNTVSILGNVGTYAELQFKRIELSIKGAFGADTQEEIAEIDKALNGLSFDFLEGIDNTAERIEKVTKAKRDLNKLEDENIEQKAKLRREIASLSVEEQRLTDIEGDATKSFQERTKAIEERVLISQERADKAVQLARLELKEARKAEEAEKARSNGELKASKETTERVTAAIEGVKSAEAERNSATAEGKRLRNQLRQDELERDLDILLDGFDNQKTINERILADTKNTLGERKKAFEENKKFQDQFIKDSENAFNQRLRADQEAGKLTQEQVDLIKEEVDLRELTNILNTKGSKALNDKIRSLKSSEILEGRISEFVREINTFKQDNVDSQNDLNDATRKTADLENEILATQEKIDSIRNIKARAQAGEKFDISEEIATKEIELQEQQLENEIFILNQRKTQFKEGSEEQLQVQQEINNKTLELEKIGLEKIKAKRDKAEEQEKERLERIKDNTKQALDFISKETDKVYSRQISRIDETIQKSKEQQDRLQEAIENGSKLGEKSLAEEIRREQEAAAQKEKLLKQQAQLQAFTAGAEVLSANDGDINQTFKDLASLKLFTNTLASAYEGTDDTGTVAKPLDSNGGRLMLIHDNEMILNKREKSELASLGYNTRNDLLNLARSTSLDSIQNGGSQLNVLNDNKGVEKRLDRMNDNIKRFSRKVSGTNNQTDNFSILLTKQNLYNSAKAKAQSKWGQ
jgi:hypothetical protein